MYDASRTASLPPDVIREKPKTDRASNIRGGAALIAKAASEVGGSGGFIGHNEVPGATHTDPGRWWWSYYTKRVERFYRNP